MKTWRDLNHAHRVNTDAEMEVLESYAKEAASICGNKLAIEIGSYCGASAILFSQYFESVISIDPWGHETHTIGFDNNLGRNPYLPIYLENIEDFKLINRVFPIISNSNVLRVLSPLGASLIYIDGAHFYTTVKNDIKNSLPHLLYDGLMVFDDICKPGFGYPPFYDENPPNPHMSRVDPYIGVKQAVEEFLSISEFEIFAHSEGLMAIQRKK